MANREDSAAIDRWVIDGAIPEQRFADLCSDPHFPAACHELSARMLDAAANDQALDGMVKDVGRFVAANWAVYLHVTGGLTLPRLKELCVTSGLLSPGRARAMLLYLQYLRYVRVLPLRARGETRRYAPTPSLMNAFRVQLQRGLEAACVIEPAIEAVLARLDEPVVLETYLRIQSDGFVRTAKLFDQTTLFFQLFLHRHAGMQLLHLLVMSSVRQPRFPTPISGPLSAAAAARRLRVSRPHIMRLLNDAEREGLLSRELDGAVVFSEETQQSVRLFFATRLIGYLICAAKTAREISHIDSPPPFSPPPPISQVPPQPHAPAS